MQKVVSYYFLHPFYPHVDLRGQWHSLCADTLLFVRESAPGIRFPVFPVSSVGCYRTLESAKELRKHIVLFIHSASLGVDGFKIIQIFLETQKKIHVTSCSCSVILKDYIKTNHVGTQNMLSSKVFVIRQLIS